MIRQSLSRLCGRARVRSSDSIRSARRAPSTSKAVLATLEPLELRRLLSGTAYTQTSQITEPGGGAAGNAFGIALATKGNLALISAPGKQVDGIGNTGEVYLYDTSTQTRLHTFDDPNPLSNDRFGVSAVFVGDDVAIGSSPGESTAENPGAERVFVFDADNYTLVQEIDAPGTGDDSDFSGFAGSLTTDGTYLYLGQGQVAGHVNGAVFQIDPETGAPLNVYQDDAAAHSFELGQSIAVSGDTVYTMGWAGVSTLDRVIVAFDKSSGNYLRSITEPPVPIPSDSPGPLFGTKMAAAPNGDLFVTDPGAVFQFAPDGTYLRDYTAPEVSIGGVLNPQNATFGASIAFNDLNQVIIGAPSAGVVDDPVSTEAGENVGGVFIFDYTDGSSLGIIQITPTVFDGSTFQLGTSVAALPDGKVLVSDPSTDSITGTVYVYAPPSTNTAPSDVTIAGQSDAARLQTVSFAGAFDDPDAGEAHTFSWDFGDGSRPDTSGLNVTHAFAATGPYTVTLTVTDSQQASASGTFVVNVTANSLQGDILYVGGTAGTDSITVGASGTGAVTVNGTSYTGASKVIIYAGDGNDTVTAYSAPASTTLEIYGGAGDDSLYAGGANDIIVGGDGNDLITGGKGRDILIGGMDSDTINGDQDDDILIAGWTVHDNDPAALEAILGVWNSSASYDSRVAQLTDPTSGTLRPDVDVFDDGIADTLKGAAGTDFFSFNNDTDTADVKKFEDSALTPTTTTDPAPVI